MSIARGIDGWQPLRPERVGAAEHEQRAARTRPLAVGSLACPSCDAPVAPAGAPLSPADPLACPYCQHAAAVRDFLSLGTPARPARVEVHVVPSAPRRAPGSRADVPRGAP